MEVQKSQEKFEKIIKIISMKRSLQVLNQKDLIIQNLQTQLTESTHTAEELAHIQTQLQNLQHRYSLLQNQHLNSKCMIHSKVEASEKTIFHLKGEISMLETQLKDKQLILSDYQHQSLSLKDQKVAKDNQAQMLRYQSQGLKSDGQTLNHERGKLQNTQLIYDNQLKEIQNDLVQLEQTKLTIAQKNSNIQRQKQSLKIEAQRFGVILKNYESENIKLTHELKQLEDKQKSNLAETTCVRQQLINQELSQTELQNRLTKTRNQLDQIQAEIRQQKDKSKDGLSALRSKAVFKDSLMANIQNEQKQTNFLIGKNSQIVDINQKLKTDLNLCENHLTNLKASIEAQKELLEKLGREDQKIVQIIQNRHILKESRSNNKLNLSRTTGFNY